MKVDYDAEFSLMYRLLYIYYFIDNSLINNKYKYTKNFAPHNLFSKSNQSSDKSIFDILYMLDEIKYIFINICLKIYV